MIQDDDPDDEINIQLDFDEDNLNNILPSPRFFYSSLKFIYTHCPPSVSLASTVEKRQEDNN